MKKQADDNFIAALLEREKARDYELRTLRAAVRDLKAPPSVNIIHHGAHDPYPFQKQTEFVWQNYHHRTLVSDEAWRDLKYKEHILQYGVEACIRAMAEAMMPSLVTREQTYAQHFCGLRT